MDLKKTAIIFTAIITILIVILFAVSKLNNDYTLQGEIEVKNVKVASKVGGRITDIAIEKGSLVKKDDIIAQIDMPEVSAKLEQTSALLEAAKAQDDKAIAGARSEQISMAYNTYKQAKAGQELAEKTYQRMKNLFKDGVISEQKRDEALAAYNSATSVLATAKANYDMAKNGTRAEDKNTANAKVKQAQGAVSEVASYLAESQVKAPVSGEITEISVEEGELVGTGSPIAVISDFSDTWATFNIREDLLNKFKVGETIKVRIPAISKDYYDFKINYISVLGNFATWRATRAKGEFDMKTFEVRMKPVNEISGLRAGMSVLIDWKKLK